MPKISTLANWTSIVKGLSKWTDNKNMDRQGKAKQEGEEEDENDERQGKSLEDVE